METVIAHCGAGVLVGKGEWASMQTSSTRVESWERAGCGAARCVLVRGNWDGAWMAVYILETSPSCCACWVCM